MNTPFEFFESFIDPKVFIATPLAWECVDGDVFSTKHMDDEELLHAIVADILAATAWEIQTNKKLGFTLKTIEQRVEHNSFLRIVDALLDPKIAFMIDVSSFRIRSDRHILESAMEFCGVWFSIYGITPPVGLISLDRDALNKAIVEHGDMRRLAESLSMDFESIFNPSNTIQ